jgi:4-hydroxybenzoate polyprenyltransferase
MLEKIIASARLKIESLENRELGAFQWIVIFSALIFLRNIAEGISTRLPSYFDFNNFFFFLHAYGFYLVSFAGLILIIYAATQEKIKNIGKFVLFLVPLVIIPPIADIIATGGHGAIMTYRQPLDVSNWMGILNSFWDFVVKGPFGVLFFGQDNLLTQLHMNYGIRIEVSVIMFMTALYIFFKTLNIWKTLLGIFFQYIGLFIVGHFPFLVVFISGQTLMVYSDTIHSQSFFNPAISSDAIIFGLYALMATLIGATIAYINNPKKYISILKNLRFLRILHNFFLLSSGIFIGIIIYHGRINFGAEDVVILACAFASIFLYWASAVFYNDSTDVNEDSISNNTRPIPSGLLTRKQSQELAAALFVASIAFASVVGYMFLLMILARALVGYLYSSPLIRLKRIPLVSQATLSLAYLFTILAGFLMISSDSILQFPSYIAYATIVGFTLGSGFKDIKDVEGDKAQKIMTLPVIFGLAKGKLIIGALGFLSFMSVFIFFPGRSIFLFITSFVAGIFYFWAVTKKDYKEWIVFVVYLTFFALLGILYIMGGLSI